MQTFREADIELRFPAAWAVLKYDDPQADFYQGTVKRTGADLSAVDFVVNPQAVPSQLLLIEVKDFRQHEVENRPRMRTLAVEIVRNTLHTLAALYVGVRAGHKSLQGIAAAVLPAPGALRLVLLLEEDALPAPGRSGNLPTRKLIKSQTRQSQKGDMQLELQRRLHGFSINASVYACPEIPRREGWEATALRPMPGP